MGDVKSLYAGPGIGTIGYAVTFTGDTLQRDEWVIGDSVITEVNGTTGLSTITSGNPQFPGVLKKGNILKFDGLNNNDSTYVRAVSYTHLTLPTKRIV